MAKGIDIPINAAVVKLNAKMFGGTANYTAYGRAHINGRLEESIPEVLNSGTNEYTDVMLNDKLDGLSFFLPEPVYEATADDSVEAKVGLYFAVDLKKLYSSVSERATEYLHEAVLDVLELMGFEFESITTGFAAFEKFGYTDTQKDNMQPFYLCRFDLIIQFNYNNC